MQKRKGFVLVFLTTVLLIFLTCFFSSRFISSEEKEISPGQGKLYVVGMGPAFPDLLTLKAVKVINEADVLVCARDIKERFPEQVKGKRVLFDPVEYLRKHHGKCPRDLSKEERKGYEKSLKTKRERAAEMIREEIEKGKVVAFLEYGDPCLFGGASIWLKEYFKESELKVIPGLSSFNVVNGLLKKDITCNGAVILTSPDGVSGAEKKALWGV